MSIKSSVERARRKRKFSKSAGITEKRVTVRTPEDQRKLDALIATQLARFVRSELSGADEMMAFSPQVREALEHVLLLKGSRDFITPHGAFSTFITTLLENGLTSEVAPAVAIYIRVYPTSVAYVLKSVPAKTSNYRFLKMLEQLCEDAGELSPELKQQTREILSRAPEMFVLSPRE